MRGQDSLGVILTLFGVSVATLTALYALSAAPTIIEPVGPESYRILYFHVPFAWSSFLSFTMLFIGAIMWYVRRSEVGWIWFQTASDLGLIFGLGVITSGPIWGSATWGRPWDWGDMRLNTFGLLTAIAMFLVLSRRSQPDTPETRDTLSAIGLFGFALVPITAIATSLWKAAHPPIIIVDNPDADIGMDPEIKTLLFFSFFIFCIIFAGFVRLSNHRYRLAAQLEQLKSDLDEGAIQ
ncbi:MAG: cytochrome c biogenesis protein CcsA, partial [bacterium]|nr:cytochrome c biogenesis protein CcsA [bacterium]